MNFELNQRRIFAVLVALFNRRLAVAPRFRCDELRIEPAPHFCGAVRPFNRRLTTAPRFRGEEIEI